jgi:hypothetical protein
MFAQFRPDFKVTLLIYRLAAGNPLCHYDTLDIEEDNQHGLGTSNKSCMLFLAVEMLLTSIAFIVTWFPDHT